jgi:hypothetical protein
MKIVVSKAEVANLIHEQGGRLYVWTEAHRCCGGGVTYLSTGAEPKRGHDFRHVDVDGFELYLDPGNLRPPDELHLDIKGFRRKRVEAYWNGCVFVGDVPVPLPGTGERSVDPRIDDGR